MPESAVFEFAAGELEQATGLPRSAARAALRDALAQALFDPRRVSAGQLGLVVERLLAAKLRSSGVGDADAICRRLAAQLAAEAAYHAGPESPDEVFSRLIRR